MPPKDKKDAKPLTPEELGLLKLWIDAGAKDDSAEDAGAGRSRSSSASLPPGVQPIVAVDMTADGTRVAAGRANVVQVYDADSGLEIVSLGGHKDIIQSLRFSPDGRRLAAGSYQIVTLWNVPTGGLAKTFTGHGEPGQGPRRRRPTARRSSRAGSTRRSGSGTSPTARRRGSSTCPPRRSWPWPSPPTARRLAVGGSDDIVRILDVGRRQGNGSR